MNIKLFGILSLLGILLSGCGGISIPVHKPVKSNKVSHSVSNESIAVRYNINGHIAPPLRLNDYFLYSKRGGRTTLIATTYQVNRRNVPSVVELFGIEGTGKKTEILGTVGDRIVYTFTNGPLGSPVLGVYDHSERKSYFLSDSGEDMMFFARGNSVVVKLLGQKKYISINNLKEVKINESKYRKLKIRYRSSNRYGTPITRSVFDARLVGGIYYGYADKFASHPPLLFGPRIGRR